MRLPMPHGIIYKENKLTLATNKIGSTLMRAQVIKLTPVTNKIGSTLMRAQVIKLTLVTNNVNTIYLVEIM